MKRFPAILLLLLVLAGKACADWPLDAVCDISNMHGNSGGGGSGTYVGSAGDKAGVITCFHLFEDGVGRVTCTFPANGQKYPARVLGVDRRNDLAMLLIEKPEGIKAVRISHVDKSAGPFTAVGFPYYSKGEPHFMVGKLIGLSRTRANTDTEFHSGYSGGALIDAHGKLVGVTVGNDGIPGRRDYVFDRSRSISNDALVDFASKWVEVEE